MENESLREVYRECLRNHAARLGGFASDGCCEFTPEEDADLGNLQCGACGCHRNFHRKVYSTAAAGIGGGAGGARRLLLQAAPETPDSRRRPRTRFSEEQKARMSSFAERIGWRIPKGRGAEVDEFCGEIGVTRQVFKVWMHNHKSSSTAAPTEATVTP
ncbi:zinc finger-homeodomain protein 1 [Canna indica]|uniref:Zinc finger-homeodomain protein 1 n=1 Tax=Canna indica TaxID=4628 RepID=A0AAQ3QBL8_9LILI|nr:zinc finger-homeodomain protein 1 [Canna indica]